MYLHRLVLIVLLLCPCLLMADGPQALQQLKFALPTGTDPKVFEHSPFCKLPPVFAKQGYELQVINYPNPRIIVEARNGNIPIAIIYTQLDKNQQSVPIAYPALETVSPPLVTVQLSVYGRSDSKQRLNSYQDIFSGKAGTVRSLYGNTPTSDDLYLFNSMEAAYKALLSGRIDWVVDSDLGYKILKEKFPEGRIVQSLGMENINLHLAFSHLYFGEQKAKDLALNYQKDMEKLKMRLGKNCPAKK